MNDEPTQTRDSLAPLLAAFDEGLAVGREPELAVPPELADDFAAARSVLRLLNEAWPRPSPADTTVDQSSPPAAARAAAAAGSAGPVRGAARAGPGRLRRRLPGLRPDAGPARRAEGAAVGSAGPRRISAVAFSRRAGPPRSSTTRTSSAFWRRTPASRPATSPPPTARGRAWRPGCASGSAAALPAGRRADGRPGGRRPPRPRARRGPPRPEAVQHPAGNRIGNGLGRPAPTRHAENLRLRPGEDAGRGTDGDAARRGDGHAAVHGAGTGGGVCVYWPSNTYASTCTTCPHVLWRLRLRGSAPLAGHHFSRA